MEINGNMKVNLDLFIEERKSKVWSQQHLSDVAGISLRTVQRIEKTGVASAESLKAISSAYEKQPSYFLGIDEKLIMNKSSPLAITTSQLWCAIAIAALLMVSFSWGYEQGKNKAISENERPKNEQNNYATR